MTKSTSFKDKLTKAATTPKDEMTKRIKKAAKGKKPVEVVDPKEAAKLQVEAIKAQGKALERVNTFEAMIPAEGVIITSDDDFAAWDEVLGRIRGFNGWWEPLIRKPIDHIRAGLDALYEVNREVTKPIAVVEAKIKEGMRQWQLQKLEEKRKLEQELENKRRQLEQKAQTPRVQEQIEQLDYSIEQVQAVPLSDAEFSHARVGKVWEVQDMAAFLRAVVSGLIPVETIMLNEKQINTYFRQSQETVASWPGVTVKDNVTIAHGRRHGG